MLCLAAHIVFGADSPLAVDTRLVPDVSPQLVRQMLGESRGGVVDLQQAEAFAYFVLGRPGPRWPSPGAWRDLWRLAALRSGLGVTVREKDRTASYGGRPSIRYRLYRRVIEIRDAMLTLTRYRDERVATEARAAAQAAGLAGGELAAAVEAAVLKAAAREKGDRILLHRPGTCPGEPPGLSADLRSETDWLVMVATAWKRMGRDAG